MLSTEEKREIQNNVLKGLQKPHVWGITPVMKDEMPYNVRVQDLKEKKYGKAISFLKEHFLSSEHLCKAVDITSSETATAQLLHLMLTWLRDGISLEAVAEVDQEKLSEMLSDTESKPATPKRQQGSNAGWHGENENEMIGLLVCRVAFKMEHSKTYSRVRIPGIGCDEDACKRQHKRTASESLKKTHSDNEETDEKYTEETPKREEEEENQLSEILKFRSSLELKIDVYKDYTVNEYLRIYVIHVLPDWQGMNIEESLFKAAIEQAKLMQLKVAMTMSTNHSEQELAKRLGMVELVKQNYKEWDEDSIISKNSREDTQAALMVKTFEAESGLDDETETLSVQLI
ncbi:uncharacterized protein LOC124163644 [Ischnura elegans]|uniref:uncharacterized protein LOC124163644 n=1 Tax=Ischnura elegans TaxID=197161 RepID=UPI001ED8ABC3|nr:uncharacterized protein LOC124163644 [Ischnura elegans]